MSYLLCKLVYINVVVSSVRLLVVMVANRVLFCACNAKEKKFVIVCC